VEASLVDAGSATAAAVAGADEKTAVKIRRLFVTDSSGS
jgi:hypothetical protein